MHIVRIVTATGLVDGEMLGRFTALPDVPEGYTAVDVTSLNAKLGDFTGKVYANGAFTDAPAPRKRILSRHEFLNRFTRAEEIALEVMAHSTASPEAIQVSAAIRVWQRRLTVAQYVDLDDPTVASTLTQMAPVLIQAGVWADARVATTRLAAILA
jgi:hypothetical protein